MESGKTVQSNVVWHWPEFQAFADRLGINRNSATERVTIALEKFKPVRVEQEFKVRDRPKE